MKSGNDINRYETRKPRRQLRREILIALATGAAFAIVASSPSGARRLLRGMRKEWDKWTVLDSLERLRKKHLVSYKEKSDGTLIVTLTRDGKKKVEEFQLDEMRLSPPQEWDKAWRIVAFDIPEKKRDARGAFRSMLNRLGFYQLQRSLFIHPFPCEAEIELIRDVFGLTEGEILFITSSQMPYFLDKRLREVFKLRV